MLFEHEFLPRIELPKRMDGPDRIYTTPDGDFRSVTTVIKKALGTKALDNWRERIGDERASEISTQAANRGNAIHRISEKYILNDSSWAKGAMPVNLYLFKSIQKDLDKHLGKVYGIEFPLWSTELRTAGQADLMAEWDGIKSVIDFKTALRIKKEKYVYHYFLQATTYALMLEERYRIKFPQIVVAIMVDHEDPQIFVKKIEEYQEDVKKIFRDQKSS